MTIRDHALRWARLGKWITYGGMLALLGALFMLEPMEFRAVAPFGGGLIGIGMLISHLLVRCPKCRGNLALAPIDRRFHIWGKLANYCQYCGVELDSPMPAKRRDG